MITPDPRAHPTSILIVDDDDGICEMIAETLRPKGYTVETAASGEEGLERLRARPFDAAIVDIMLPDISGLDLLEAVQAASSDAEIIFISGYVPLSKAIQAINGGAFAYLKKPFELDHLVATLEKALEKQRLARALRESEERYRLITENVNDAIFLVDLDGRLVFSNRRWGELTGFGPEQLQGRSILSLLTSEGGQQAWAQLGAVRADAEVFPLFETQIVRKDGSRLWVEAAFTSVLKDDRLIGRLGVARDITERRRLQEELIQAEKLATLGELIAGIAHELNNPLTTMVGHAELLRLGQQDPKLAARAERILEAARRATGIIRNFLTAARRHRPEKVSVSVNDIIAKTLDLLGYQCRVNNIEVRTALSPDLPPTAGDPHQLQQMILNLVNNAVHAMATARGRGNLTVGSALSPDRSTITITVADDGHGISPEQLPRIFDPFFTTKPEGEGTGLGLTLARGIASDHGGTITVESTPGEGATFVVTLAVTAPPAAEPEPVAPIPAAPGLKVLVVDDEAPVRDLMAEALAEWGADVETAASGQEALEVLARAAVDLLVLDIRMPGMGGTELWRQLSRINEPLARRTVFCTGDVVGEESRKFLLSTGCPTVTKPFELKQLFDAVARAASR